MPRKMQPCHMAPLFKYHIIEQMLRRDERKERRMGEGRKTTVNRSHSPHKNGIEEHANGAAYICTYIY